MAQIAALRSKKLVKKDKYLNIKNVRPTEIIELQQVLR